MTEIMPVPRNLILLSYQQGGSAVLFKSHVQSIATSVSIQPNPAEDFMPVPQ